VDLALFIALLDARSRISGFGFPFGGAKATKSEDSVVGSTLHTGLHHAYTCV
jgi:hypothetical protein